MIFNKSLIDGQFPDIWKEIRIVPVYKSGKQKDVKNYRPISIISTMAKAFESLVYQHMYTHLKNYVRDKQHGFMCKRSTNTNLLLHVTNIAECIDHGYQMDAIYADFSKAFDKVNHRLLLSKLQANGISDSLLKWSKSYLVNRKSRVVINGHQSEVFIAESGVPQGSNLGPLFFNIFINDITDIFFNSNASLFADDLKLTRIVHCDNDIKLLQEDLSRLNDWCNTNKMFLNVDKCYHIKFTRNKNTLLSVYDIDDRQLTEVSMIRDLGVVLDSKLTFVPHIDKTLDLANKSLGFVLRTSKNFKRCATIIRLAKQS
ncbi:jg23518 [Pararge aegeria aegeria]|uniref:Jg23518 protein n=1 Tax=Pararge aegeria aegeria TaxID=348720 RepID=A0A8S4QXL6_9NEOP|nr:jg23518 [Pararge aegeria aegeria]